VGQNGMVLAINPEHFVLAFAHDVVDGKDAFLFWDPDAQRSQITSTNWGPGFGCLFSTAGRLSTAVDDADLTNIVNDPKSDKDGDHLSDQRRHRYQVYWVKTLVPGDIRLKRTTLFAS
jgi:hypothetical protein